MIGFLQAGRAADAEGADGKDLWPFKMGSGAGRRRRAALPSRPAPRAADAISDCCLSGSRRVLRARRLLPGPGDRVGGGHRAGGAGRGDGVGAGGERDVRPLEDAVGAGGPLIVLLGILILPWLWSLPTALMTAELSTAMPEDGGYVVWVEKAFGRFWGFQEGWLSWLCSFADNALYPVMFVDYLAYLRGDMAPLERWLIGAALIGAITWLNIRGTRLVGRSR